MTAKVSGYKKKKKCGAWNTQFYSLSLFKNLAQRAHLLPARDGAAVTWQRAQARCHLIWLPWLVSCLERAAQTQCGGLPEAMGRNAADWGWPCSSGGWRDTLSAGGSPLSCRRALGSASHSLPLAPSEGELCVWSPAPGHRRVLLFHKDDTPRAFGTPRPRVSPAYVHRTARWDTDRSASWCSLRSQVLRCGRCSPASVGLIRLIPKPRGAPWGSRQNAGQTHQRQVTRLPSAGGRERCLGAVPGSFQSGGQTPRVSGGGEGPGAQGCPLE